MTLRKLAQSLLLPGALLLGSPVVIAQDDTTDVLIQVLLRKGVLTQSEAAEIRQEVTSVMEAQKAEIVSTAVAEVESKYVDTAPHVPMPSALSDLTLYGNARFRYHFENRESRAGENNDRSRWRYRIRLGSVYQFKESPFSLGAQLETATSNDSNNTNFGGFFDKAGGGLNLGRIYLDYRGEDWRITFGKHGSPFYLPRMLWDGDLNVEGLSESTTVGNWTFTAGQYIIDEENESREVVGGPSVTDDALLMAQAAWSNNEGLKIAPIFMATTGGTSNFSESGVFAGANAVTYFHDFVVAAVPFEYAFRFDDGLSHKIFGAWGTNFKGDELINDPDSPFFDGPGQSSKNQFANLGYQLGSAKKAGQRQFSVEYRYMEAAGYTPNLSDSDWAGGEVNQQGWVINFRHLFTDFFGLSVTYFDGDSIDDDYLASPGNLGNTQVLLVDGEIKF